MRCKPRCVTAADHLATAQQLLGREVRAPHLPDVTVVSTVRNGLALPCHRGEPDDGALPGLPVDLGQHHVGCHIGEGAGALDRRQLTRIAQHQDRFAEGQKVSRHLGSDHRDLVEHDELGLAHQRLLVEYKAWLVNVAEAKLEALEPLHREQLLRRRQASEAGAQIGGLLLDPRDLLRRRFRDPIDQAVNGRCRRALARHHQRGLAGEGGEQHTAGGTAVPAHRR